MLDAIENIPWDSLATLSSPKILFLLLLGVTGGLAVGITPGLGPTIAVALLIPVTFTMPPDEAFAILTAVYVGGMSGGALTAILLRLPGTPASMATVLDGFPLAQRGEAGRAIGNAIIASFFGTIIGALFLVLLAPLLARFALKFHFAEYAAVSIFALTSVAALTGPSTAFGLLSAVVGMLLATVGLTQEDGLPRFTFGLTDLQAGFRLIPALIGLFAVSQLMKTPIFTGAESSPKLRLDPGGSYLPSARDILANKMNYIRSGIIGTFVGVIPALGGGPAALIAYAQARNASADRDQFGKGSIEGLIASETANNATIGGGLIIALTVGIPGDPTSAVLLGGLMIHGAQPGPQLFGSTPEILYGIYFSLFISSMMMVVVLFAVGRYIVHVVRTPPYALNPVLLAMCIYGVFSLNNSVGDIWVMLGFGCLGYLMEHLRYPLPPLVLGLILGPLVEGNVRKLLGAEQSLVPLVTRPLALSFLVLSVVSLLMARRFMRF